MGGKRDGRGKGEETRWTTYFQINSLIVVVCQVKQIFLGEVEKNASLKGKQVTQPNISLLSSLSCAALYMYVYNYSDCEVVWRLSSC